MGTGGSVGGGGGGGGVKPEGEGGEGGGEEAEGLGPREAALAAVTAQLVDWNLTLDPAPCLAPSARGPARGPA